MHKRYLAIFLLISPALYADNAANYRGDFMRNCLDQNDDAQAEQLCDCVFDSWLDQLPSKTDAKAITATKLIANVEGDYLPSEIQQSAAYMSNMQDLSMQCADKVMGPIRLGGYEADSDYDNSGATIPSNETVTEAPEAQKKRGLFGAVVGWAGQKAGLPDAVNEAAADKADENEGTIKEKLNPLKSRFNPFNKNKEE